jgi:folate-binding protein YgfZ
MRGALRTATRRSLSAAPSLARLGSPRWHAALDSRGVLVVEGADARKLLQGLVTSDVTQLDAGPQYTAFLSAQGRMLHDAFLLPGPEGSVLIDADRAALPALAKHIKRYKLRSKAQVRDASEELGVTAVSSALSADAPADGADAPACEGGAWADPRLPSLLGARLVRPRGAPVPAWMDGGDAADEALYALQLLLLGVPSGAQQLPAAAALPLEANLELLNGVSFAKGCYLGQELTVSCRWRPHSRTPSDRPLIPYTVPLIPSTRDATSGLGQEPYLTAPSYCHPHLATRITLVRTLISSPRAVPLLCVGAVQARTHFRGVVRKRLLPVAHAPRLNEHAPTPSSSEQLVPASLSHLPAAEQAVAAALLRHDGALAADGAAAGAWGAEGAAHDDADDAGKAVLRDGKGKKAGMLRSYDPANGLGMALCRLDAAECDAGSDGLGAPPLAAADEELPPLAPLRPSWWPDDVGRAEKA